MTDPDPSKEKYAINPTGIATDEEIENWRAVDLNGLHPPATIMRLINRIDTMFDKESIAAALEVTSTAELLGSDTFKNGANSQRVYMLAQIRSMRK